MLILPVRPQPPRLRIQESNDSCATSTSSANPDQDLHLARKPSSQATSTMISVMPPLKPPSPKRPKLSLQTFAAASALGEKAKTKLTLSAVTDTPSYTNTYPTTFVPPPATPLSIQHMQKSSSSCPDDEQSPPSSNSSSASSSSFGLASPFPVSAPYSLPIGTHSILRNSPLPRRHISAASTRINRRMFPPVKHVIFREILEDIIPKPVANYSSDASDSDGGEKRPRASFEQTEFRGRLTAEEKEEEGVLSTPVHRRRKRRREWVWRPLDDDILTAHHTEEGIESSNAGHSTEEAKIIDSRKPELTSAHCGVSAEIELIAPIISKPAYPSPLIELGYQEADVVAQKLSTSQATLLVSETDSELTGDGLVGESGGTIVRHRILTV